MLDIAQRVIGAELIERDAAQRFVACVVVIGGKKAGAIAHPDALIREDSLDLPLLKLDLVQIARLARRKRHHGLVQSEVEDDDDDCDGQHRHGHLEPAHAELLAGQDFAAAVQQRKAEQDAGETGDR